MKIMKKQESVLIICAYLSIIIIWSTTPLAIKWSSEGIGFVSGIFMRMFIGTCLALILSLLWHRKIPLHKQALEIYLASSLGIYGAMMSVYWGAQYIPSGLIAVIYGLTPLVTSFLASYILLSEKLSWVKISGVILGFCGLIIIFIDQINMQSFAIWGVISVIISVILHSISAVWIKKINAGLPALIITSGGLAMSLPLFILTFIIFAQPLPIDIPEKTLISIIYLGIIGSVIGFVSYYYVLSKLTTSTVALVTLITPISALVLGKIYNQEIISPFIWYGTSFVLVGLVLHQWGEKLPTARLFTRIYNQDRVIVNKNH